MTSQITTPRIEQIISTDGTPIGYRRGGDGPPLLLVHGAAADHTRWAGLLPALEQRFTVYALDRRGRGASGDAPTYAIEREFEDVAAVVDAIGGPVDVLGHSYGALCALEAALRTSNIGRLLLYEPPIPTGVEIFPGGIIDRLRALLEAGERDELLTTFFREAVRASSREIEMLPSLPSWEARVAAAHTIPRELRASEEYRFAPGRFGGMTVPTLLLLGGESASVFVAATAAAHAALPASRVAVMPGQQHVAMSTAPELFLGEVFSFLGAE